MLFTTATIDALGGTCTHISCSNMHASCLIGRSQQRRRWELNPDGCLKHREGYSLARIHSGLRLQGLYSIFKESRQHTGAAPVPLGWKPSTLLLRQCCTPFSAINISF